MKKELALMIIEHRTAYAVDIQILKDDLKHNHTTLDPIDIGNKNWLIEVFKWELEYADELLKIILGDKNVFRLETE